MPTPIQSPISLTSLTAAALLLPGLLQHTAQAADDDSVDFQYSHYQEGKRDIYGMVTNPSTFQASVTKIPYGLNPIEVDSIHGSSRISLTDRIKFSFNYTQDTWSGATPIGTAPALGGANNPVFLNRDLSSGIVVGASPMANNTQGFVLTKNLNNYYQLFNPTTGETSQGKKENRLTHVMSYASPETRKQGDFKLSYQGDDAAVTIGGGLSLENDYESRFVNLGGRIDFNNKLTTLNVGLSYTNSDTQATLDPKGLQFWRTENYETLVEGKYVPNDDATAQIESFYSSGINQRRTSAILHGKRQDWGADIALTHVFNKNAVLNLGMGFNRSTGYLSNPYKLVYVIGAEIASDQRFGLVQPTAMLELRPEERNQFNWNVGISQYIEPLDAALHFNYRFAHDDWGINAHTFDADWVQPLGQGWTVTPNIRFYSQEAADFYTPYISEINVYDVNTGETIPSLSRVGPKYYSSDHRLSGFGTLSGGLILSKQFTKGISLETGFEYYTHQGSLMLGGSGEKAFADYDFWSANAALKVNLEALAGGGGNHTSHSSHPYHQHSHSPAGVMFDHALAQAGDMMVGYRFMRSEQAGDILTGSQPVSLDTVKLEGCDGKDCSVAPKTMTMSMHMLDLMYAPTDWLSLMLMPQWMDMEMTMDRLSTEVGVGHGAHAGHLNGHQTGGVGDTGIYALFKVFDQPNHHLTLSLGGTAPTGDVGVVQNRGLKPYIHYAMQLGSGTWDFKPSLTYTGEIDSFNWGAQATGTLRLESRNSSNFAFGDNFQGSVWGGYDWTNWLGTTVRGVYTWQDSIRGGYLPVQSGIITLINNDGPFDQTGSYGGQFVDLGLGVNVTIPAGSLAGNTLKFEWLQPLHTDYNGYQLDRDGSLAFTWSYGF